VLHKVDCTECLLTPWASGPLHIVSICHLRARRLRPGLAMSQDGRNWARIEGPHHTGALFDVGEEGEWDQLYIGSPQVHMSGLRSRLG